MGEQVPDATVPQVRGTDRITVLALREVLGERDISNFELCEAIRALAVTVSNGIACGPSAAASVIDIITRTSAMPSA